MRDAGVVRMTEEGTRNLYELDLQILDEVRRYLEGFWDASLRRLKKTAESSYGGIILRGRQAMSVLAGEVATQAQDTSVRAEIVVETPIDTFAVFTEGFGSWKPPEHNLHGVELAGTVFETRVGGYVYDRGVDGSECRWARVLAFEPPNRVVLGWSITPQWRIVTDISRVSEVEVRFIAEASDRTRVQIEHRHLERHGEGWETMRDAVGCPGGWPLYLQRFAQRLAA